MKNYKILLGLLVSLYSIKVESGWQTAIVEPMYGGGHSETLEQAAKNDELNDSTSMRIANDVGFKGVELLRLLYNANISFMNQSGDPINPAQSNVKNIPIYYDSSIFNVAVWLNGLSTFITTNKFPMTGFNSFDEKRNLTYHYRSQLQEIATISDIDMNYLKVHFAPALKNLGSIVTTNNLPTASNPGNTPTIGYSANSSAVVSVMVSTIINNTKETFGVYQNDENKNQKLIGILQPGENQFPLYGAAQSSQGDIVFKVVKQSGSNSSGYMIDSSKSSWRVSFENNAISVQVTDADLPNKNFSFIKRSHTIDCSDFEQAVKFIIKIEDDIILQVPSSKTTPLSIKKITSNVLCYPSIMGYSLVKSRYSTVYDKSFSYTVLPLLLPPSLYQTQMYGWIYVINSMLAAIQTNYQQISPIQIINSSDPFNEFNYDNMYFVTKSSDATTSKVIQFPLQSNMSPAKPIGLRFATYKHTNWYYQIPHTDFNSILSKYTFPLYVGKIGIHEQPLTGNFLETSSDIPTTSALQSYITTLQSAKPGSFEEEFAGLKNTLFVSTTVSGKVPTLVQFNLTASQVKNDLKKLFSYFYMDTLYSSKQVSVLGLTSGQSQLVQSALQQNYPVALELDTQVNSSGGYDQYLRGYIVDKGLWFKFIKIFEQKFSSVKDNTSKKAIKSSGNPAMGSSIWCKVPQSKNITQAYFAGGTGLFYIVPAGTTV